MAAGVIVVDASAAVDLLLVEQPSDWVEERLTGKRLSVPGHFHAEVLSSIGKSLRRGLVTVQHADRAVHDVGLLPVEVASVDRLLVGAWARRDQHALPDALYVELAAQLDTVVVTTDRRLARATPLAVAPPG